MQFGPCFHCGQRVNLASRICTSCGADLVSRRAPTPTFSPPNFPAPDPFKVGGVEISRGWLTFALLVLVILCINQTMQIFMGIESWSEKSKAEGEINRMRGQRMP